MDRRRASTGTVVAVTLGLVIGVPVLGALLPAEEPEPPPSLSIPELEEIPVDDGGVRPERRTITTTTVPTLPLFGPFDSDRWGPVGTCFSNVLLEEVPCERRHDHEVFHRSRFDGPYLGPMALHAAGARSCEEAYAGRTGESAIRNGVLVEPAVPSAIAWRNGLREVVCVAVTQQTTGSVLDG